ncbi:MAG TPA: hypothetical protein PLU93_07145 [Treponemataceae bacterium]|jgi:hypothetical protein|nr:hypothetical protein [Treponemataceae bacterium]
MISKSATVPKDARILELREKIKDEGYVQGAIHRIASVLSNRLIEIKDTAHERK